MLVCYFSCILSRHYHFIRILAFIIRCKIQYIKTNDINKATVAHVIPPPHCGEDALCLLQKDENDHNDDDDEDYSIFFIFQQLKYSLDNITNKFIELDFPTNFYSTLYRSKMYHQ